MLGDGFYDGVHGPTIDKDPQAVLTYGVAMGKWLEAGDTLASVEFTVPAGLNRVSQSINTAAMTIEGESQGIATVALVRLSGGLLGVVYPVRLHYITTNGHEDDVTLSFNMVNR